MIHTYIYIYRARLINLIDLPVVHTFVFFLLEHVKMIVGLERAKSSEVVCGYPVPTPKACDDGK